MKDIKTIEKIIKSKEAPKNTNVIWLDLNETEDIDNPSLKVFNNGEWVHITADMQEFINTLDIVLQDKADLVGGKVPASQLPSYVDDVQEFYGILSRTDNYVNNEIYFNNGRFSDLYPNSFIRENKQGVIEEVYKPERGKLYLATTTNKLYRWTGSTLLDITQKGLQLGTSSTEAFSANLGYKHETGRFGSNYNIQISDGRNSNVYIGTSGTQAVNIYDNVNIGTGVSITRNSKIGTNHNAVNIYGNIGTGSKIGDSVNIDSGVNIGDGVSISSNAAINGSTIKIGTTNAYIGIGHYDNRNAYINIQGIVQIGTMSNSKVEMLGNIYMGNTSETVYVGNNYQGTYDKKATTIAKGVYIGNGTFIGSNIQIGAFDTVDKYGLSTIQIGTISSSSIHINGLNVTIGTNQSSKILIGVALSSNPVTKLSSGEVYIGERVMILNDFDTRNIKLGTDSKSKIYINNTAGELSFGTSGNNYAVTFGSNSITFTNKLTNLSTSLTLA